jgi:hypothetical protein
MSKLLRELAESGKAAPRSSLPIKPLVSLLEQMAGVPATPVSLPLLVSAGTACWQWDCTCEVVRRAGRAHLPASLDWQLCCSRGFRE